MPKLAKMIAVIFVAVSTLGAGAYLGWEWWTVGRYLEKTDNAYIRGDITPISPKVTGYVGELLVEDNQHIRAGDVLVRIVDREFRLAVVEAEARVAETRAAIANVMTRIILQKSVVEQALANIAAAEAELLRADKELERARELVRTNAGTPQKSDKAQADRQKAAALLRGNRARYREVRQQISVLESERKRLSATVARNKAAVELTETRLADTAITAPISGVVGNRAVRLGQYVRPGTLLMAVVPLDYLWVVANFKETQLTRMQTGQYVEITVDAFPDLILNGRVQSVSPASGAEFSLLPPENATGNFTKLVQRIPVKIVLDNTFPLADELRPGMSVEVIVDTRKERSVSTLSRERK